MRMLLAVVVVVVGCAGLAACAGPEDEGGGGDGVPELDAGPDSGTDAGDVDAGTDAGDVLRCPADFDCSPGDHCRDDGTCETCPVPVAAEACAAAEASCGKLVVTVCGVGREVDCGTCSFGACGSVTANVCPVCVPNTAAERCAAVEKCGMVPNRDSCNVDVIDDCGGCPDGQTCRFSHCG